ncbi:M13 family metallopeptidase [Sphingomonas crocodyli]|uniref:M13 family metallopeptidase n=1 Tax=Sphingomonas crocodyli TaxID=1979270 RepID=UPI0019D0206A|nr:M13 family metallopeptidase [Sphingomonas crocodyli]
MKINRLLLAASAMALLASPLHALTTAKPRFGTFGVDLTAIDKAVKPGDDFWTYVNGAWDKRTPIAADRTSAGVSVLLVDEAEAQVKAIVEDLAKNPASAGKSGQQIGDFYASWMDEAGIEAAGTKPLAPYLARVDAVKDKVELQKLFTEIGYTAPIGVGILPDPADTSRYVAMAGQAGLGLPNRDYYLNQGEKYDTIRKAYRLYVAKMLTLAGISDADARADKIIALETELAKVQWAPERQRDIKAIYNPMDRAGMEKLAPEFDWDKMLVWSGLGDVKTVIMGETTAIAATGKLLDSTPLDTWKDYSKFHFIRTHAMYLPKAFDDANFDFFGRTLRGQPEQRARWKRGIQLLNDNLGEAIGAIYVERHYPPASSAKMDELIVNLRAALKERLDKLEWMDEPTRAAALLKLSTFDPRVGHPIKYVDYSSMTVKRGALLDDALAAEKFEWDLQLSRLPKPVDRTLWEMTPQTVNAYYDPLMNQITFPAAILQPPFFDPNSDPAVNYGSIGAIIGHEIGHGFDDQGRQFDEKGRIRDWWTPVAAERFAARTKNLGGQFDAYEPLPGVHIKGELTMGENIGDLGGVEMAYSAYRRYVAQHGEPPVIDGLTGDQRFFLAYGQSWRSKLREGRLREQLLTDPHSPAYYRVNGIVRNVDAWYKAFDVKPGDKMYLPPEQRVHIW